MKKLLPITIACLVVATVTGACGSPENGTDAPASQPSTATTASTTGSTEPSKEAATFKDGVLTTPDFKIEITDHKVIPVGKKGNEYGEKPVLGFWYKTTNVSGTDVDPLTAILNFTAFQDTNPNAENELNVAALPDDRFLDSQTEKIKKGGTVENAIAYELDDLTTPVVLVASTDLGFSEVGRMSYSLK